MDDAAVEPEPDVRFSVLKHVTLQMLKGRQKEQVWFLRSTWNPSSVELELTDGKFIYVGELTNDAITARVDDLVAALDFCRRMLVTECNSDRVKLTLCAVPDTSSKKGGAADVAKKRDPSLQFSFGMDIDEADGAVLLFELRMRRLEPTDTKDEPKAHMREMLQRLIENDAHNFARIAALEVQIADLHHALDVELKKLDERTQDKLETESVLIQKFALLLAAKTDEIRRLRAECESGVGRQKRVRKPKSATAASSAPLKVGSEDGDDDDDDDDDDERPVKREHDSDDGIASPAPERNGSISQSLIAPAPIVVSSPRKRIRQVAGTHASASVPARQPTSPPKRGRTSVADKTHRGPKAAAGKPGTPTHAADGSADVMNFLQ